MYVPLYRLAAAFANACNVAKLVGARFLPALWFAHDGVPTIDRRSLMPEFAAYRSIRSYSDQLYAESLGSAAAAGFLFATANLLPPQ